jgi:hypothetical protein
VVFQESAQVLRGGPEVLLGQPDQERLGHLRWETALGLAVGFPGCGMTGCGPAGGDLL